MTRNDYRKVAATIKKLVLPPGSPLLRVIAKRTKNKMAFDLCSMFRENDDRFNEQAFLKSCGYYD